MHIIMATETQPFEVVGLVVAALAAEHFVVNMHTCSAFAPVARFAQVLEPVAGDGVHVDHTSWWAGVR